MEPTTLNTARLELRPFGPADEDEVYAACQDPDIQRWTMVPSPYAREHARGFVGELVPGGWREDTAYSFAVRLGPGGPLVAAVGVHVHEVFGTKAYEIGFWAVKEHRGQGFMTEAVSAVARWAFTELGAARLEWRAEVGNTASRAVAEKAGFRMEGLLRASLHRADSVHDSWVGALLPGDLGITPAVPYLPSGSRTSPLSVAPPRLQP
ncbi:GNAT family N-acetyltransferase [Streptomyces sp. XY332]|uniref:GNAT family N-acetyltransferase n=1 Tax=Streptomyces sp. XY332 TaxID=1415561 RepID=UPI00061FE6E1|nr:GNAT family N-acetyltransferase [Streptomyces sp. XY332]KJY41030.1 acetyltransferase [Streptomyces sp. NRRL S-444]KOY59655.1 acetyltransferase [Streptomyces sp. XY332]